MLPTDVRAERGASLIARDRGLVWHPYAPLDGPEPYAVLDANGVRLELVDGSGRRFSAIDAMSSWWCAAHGYRDPELERAIAAQHAAFDHVMFGGLTHEPAVALAERLVALAPEPLAHVFFADSGSVSVEVALKLAIQLARATGHPERTKLLSLRGAYHGDTTGAMSLCDPVDGMHSAFSGILAEHRFAPRPPAARRVGDDLVADAAEVSAWTAAVDSLIDAHGHELAGIIVEPILQGAGGMHIWAPECLRVLRDRADRLGIPLIADEIATGFGRTGRRFACEWAGVVPDLLCVGKALTGGTMTLAALLCTSEIAAAIGRSEERALMHGPTFMANPLACAAANASVELLEERFPTEVPRIEARLAAGLAPALASDAVADVRVLGATGVVALHDPVDVPAVTRAALERGVWVRPFRNLVYTMPPYITSDPDLDAICAAIIGAVDEVHGR